MRIRTYAFAALLLAAPFEARAGDEHGGHPTVFHGFQLEADIGEGDDTIFTWDFDGWIGTDFDKLWLKSEGEIENGDRSEAEIWAMYSRNVAEFWDAQFGLRYDDEPQSLFYLAAGLNGLARYFFETEAHLFFSDDGDLSGRLRQEHDLLITQRLVFQPYLELNFFAQDVPELDTGAGLSEGELGLQARYEITRKFAPYLELRYQRKFGETSQITRQEGDSAEDFIVSAGLRLRF